jgi:hypothetical protein
MRKANSEETALHAGSQICSKLRHKEDSQDTILIEILISTHQRLMLHMKAFLR